MQAFMTLFNDVESPTAGQCSAPCRFECLAFFLIMAVGAFLRLYGLGCRDFNLDEAYSFLFARDYPFWEVFSPLSSMNRIDPHPTLHYVLSWIWMHTAYPLLQGIGFSMEAAFRSLSALISMGSLLMTMHCGRQIAGLLGGLLAGLLLAFNGMAVSLAQEARMYSLLELAGACFLAAIIWYQSGTGDRWQKSAMLILASWFLMLSHYVGIIFVVLGWSWLFFFTHREWRVSLAVSAIVLTGLYAYWLMGFFLQFGNEQAGSGGGFKLSTGLVVPFTYFSFLAGETLVSIKARSDLVQTLPWISATFIVAASSLLGGWRLWYHSAKERRRKIEAVAWLTFIPILVMLIGSFWVHKLFMSVRYAAAALVPFFILITVGLVAWVNERQKTLVIVVFVGYLLLSVTALSNMYLLKVKPPPSWKAVAAYLNDVNPAAIAIYSPYMKLPLSLYYSGAPLIELPEQRIVSWEELVRIKPELDRPDSDIVLMLSHPRQFKDQYLQFFSDSGTLQPMKSGFFDVELWLRRGVN